MSMVDELQLTKKRLQNLRRKNFGLQQLAVREISNQLTFYRTHSDELEKLKNLPGVLRDKILQVIMKKKCLDLDEQGEKMEFENLKEIFPLLLSPRTRYIKLNGILSFCPDRFKDGKIEKVTEWCVELLKQVETRAPQVQTLIINRKNPFDIFNSYFENDEFNQDMVQSLMKMKKLKRLNVNLYDFPVTDLLKICKNLSSLQYINVGLSYHRDEDQPAREEVLSSFSNLKEFTFYSLGFEWLGCLCVRNLPNIEVVQFDPNKIMRWTHIRKYDSRYCGLDFTGTSNVRHIFVNPLQHISKKFEEMPNLFPKATCLMVKNSSLDDCVMPQFADNIRQLHLLNPYGTDIIEKYLICYGQKLQSLYIRHDLELITIDLESIFKHCPKLEKLSLLNTLFKTQPSKIEFFAELKELELEIPCNVETDGTHDAEHMVLSTILAAPKLEKVELESWTFNENDLLKLNSLIQEKRILKNLHTLHVYFISPINQTLANVLKSACAFLPKLTDFKYAHIFSLELNKDPLLASQPTPESDIDASVFKMIDVFEKEK